MSGITKDISVYKKLTDTEHVLLRPGMYLGSIITNETKQFLPETDPFGNVVGIKEEVINFNYALLKLFDEIISNSVDESKRNPNLRSIDVNISNGTVSVWDDGGIPVKKHPDYDQYIPEMIFSELRAGSNFDDDSEETRTGQNGMGSSLVNIFSKEFTVETCDGVNRYIQTWSNNMSNKTEPEITPNTRHGYTRITFTPDIERFGLESIDNQMITKLLKRTIDIVACNPHLKIRFCGSLIKITSFEDYIKLFEIVKQNDELIYQEDPLWKVGVTASNDGFRQVSFVNSTETSAGGTHIDYVSNQIVNKVREFILKKHKVDIKPSDIRNHMFLFVDCVITNPRYASQTKDNLITEPKFFKSSWSPSEKFIKAICESSIVENILNWMAAKDEVARREEMKKHAKDIKKLDPRTIEKFVDATTKKREDAILFVVEGDSAAGGLKNNRVTQTMGVFPLRGKPMNVSEHTITSAMRNVEFKNLMAICGLIPGEESPLRFGKIVIATDQDLDGFHIRGLILNMFNKYFPELIREGRIYIFNTPLAKVQYKKKTLNFYSMGELEKWVSEHEGETFSSKYYKGLGTSTDVEWQEYLTQSNLDQFMVRVDLDENGSDNLEIVFGKGSGAANRRKEWLGLLEGSN